MKKGFLTMQWKAILASARGMFHLVVHGDIPPGERLRKGLGETVVGSGAQRPKYWAFISYSHHDRRIARWCREALSRESVPRALRGMVEGESKRVSPIFLDEEAIAAAPRVSAELRSALEQSRYLIVICSPFAAASSYVKDEIAYFQSLDRGNRILCLVASGIPNAADRGQPSLECFPEPLRVCSINGVLVPVPEPDRPLAAVLGDETPEEKAKVVRQLIGGLFGVSDGAVRLIQVRRSIFRLAAVVSIAVSALLLLAAFVFPWHTYSFGFVRRNGVWQEVDLTSRSRAIHGGNHFEFTRRGLFGKPLSVKFLDGFGRCPADGMLDVLWQSMASPCNTSRACEARFTYTQNGDIETEKLLDQYGTTLETLRYTDSSVALFTQAGFGCSQSRSGVYYVNFERYPDEGPQKGLDKKVTFWGKETPDRKPRVNEAGAYGILNEYDSAGRVTRQTLLSADGQPQTGRDGYASSTFTYDHTGQVIDRRNFSPSGSPVIIKDGFSSFHRTVNTFGAILTETYLDMGGNPVNASWGYASIHYDRGAHGEPVREAYLDPSGKPVTSSRGMAGRRFTYDSQGNIKQTAYFDAVDKPTTSTGKVAGYADTFDAWGNPASISYFGIDGKPAFSDDGFVTQQTSYDDRGNPIEHRFMGMKGELIRQKNGYSILRQKFNEHNRRIDVKYFDPSGAPTLNDDGYAEWQMEYDENGNETAEIQLGIDGKPTLDNTGVFKMIFNYNDQGLKIETRFLGLNGQPSPISKEGDISIIRYNYDALGREVKRSFFDAEDHPAENSEHYASFTTAYDARSRKTEYRVFGADGNPVKDKLGAFIERYVLDERGNFLLQQFLDPSGNAILSRDGEAAIRFVPNRLGNTLSGRYLGLDMQPAVATSDKVAGWNATFDDKGQQLAYEEVDLDGNPVAGQNGVVRTSYRYNTTGDQIEVHFTTAAGKPMLNKDGIAGWQAEFDDRHREVERTFLSLDGKPIVSPKLMYAGWREKFDDRGRQVEASYFGLDGRLALNAEGYSICRTIYDNRGNLLESSFFDQNGQPAQRKEAAKAVYVYNKYGWEIERRFYGVDGKLIKNPTSGRAIVRTEYDEAGRIVMVKSFDEHDAPVNRVDRKYFKQTITYDQTGKAARVCTTTAGRVIASCPEE